MYRIVYTKKAVKDLENIKSAKLNKKVIDLMSVLEINPYQNPPQYEKLLGNLEGAYSRRINLQHRLVYEISEARKEIKIISLWSHYEF